MAKIAKKHPIERLVGWLWVQWREWRIYWFYRRKPWRDARRAALAKYGRRCMRCDTTGSDKNWICVDHIKSVRRYWHLRLNQDNLQVLCLACNRWKGSWNETDFRPSLLTRLRWF